MVRIDEAQEAVAQIRTAVDADKQASDSLNKDIDEVEKMQAEILPSTHWNFGAPCHQKMTANFLESELGPTDSHF